MNIRMGFRRMMIREWTKMMDQRNILRARWISSCRRGELFVAGDNREGGAFFRFSVGTRVGQFPFVG